VADGELLSTLCIFGDCRQKLKKLSTLLLKGLKIIASGTSFFYEIENITPDNIYYFDMGVNKYLTFTDIRYNHVPFTDPKRAPWSNDMDKVG